MITQCKNYLWFRRTLGSFQGADKFCIDFICSAGMNPYTKGKIFLLGAIALVVAIPALLISTEGGDIRKGILIFLFAVGVIASQLFMRGD